MFKAMILLTRREDLSSEEFADWWLNRHLPLARSLPGLRKLCFNLVTDGSCDGVSELWFDDVAAFEAAYASETGQAVAADSRSMLAGRTVLRVVEHAHEPLKP